MVRKYFVLIFVLFPMFAFSHDVATPFLVCKKDKQNIVCISGYSNGSHAKGNKINLVKVKNNEVLEKKVFTKNSKIIFENIPQDDFYILMNLGNGKNNIEITKKEILE